jgi:spore maturation protein SpmA
MTTAKDLCDQLINRAKNLQEFVVERDFDHIPTGVVKFNIQHTVGQPARIFVPALTQTEAETMVDEWFEEDVE